MTSKLLTHEQMYAKYKELENSTTHIPYFYKLTKNGNVLYFLGTAHSNDPENTQFKEIKLQWKAFLKETSNSSNPKLVLVEGLVLEIPTDENSAITKYNEPGYTTYLSNKENIAVTTPEPPEDLEVTTLLTKHTKEEVALYYFLNIAYQGINFNIEESLEEYVDKYPGYYFYKPQWEGFDFSIAHLKELYKDKFKKDITKEDKAIIYEFVKPTDTNISGESSDIRDTHILNTILEYWEENNLFIVYGSGHAIRLEKSLREK